MLTSAITTVNREPWTEITPLRTLYLLVRTAQGVY